jgi:hypothetical protein
MAGSGGLLAATVMGSGNGNGSGGVSGIITNEQPTNVLKFDKNYAPLKTLPLIISGSPLNLTLNGEVANDVGNINYLYIQADGVQPINLDSNFNNAAIFPNDLSGKVLDAGLYRVYCFYTTNGIEISVPAVSGATPDTPPTATNILISGSPVVGQTLTGSYTYNDINGDPEQGTTFQWYRADDNIGTNEAAISGATSTTYILQAADENKYIRLGVTPANVNATGDEAFSAYTQQVLTVDTQPPVISFIPADGAINQPVDGVIKVVSNEAIRQIGGAEITNANAATLISLRYPQLLQDITFTASINAGKTEITIVPDSNLLFNRDIETTLADVEDNSSNAVGGDSIGTFTTASSGVFDPETIGSVATLLYGENIAVADDAEVLTWPDASLETKPAVATTGTAPIAKTVNGQKVARFDGIDNLMTISGLTNLGGTDVEESFFVVCRANTPVAAEGDRTPFSLDNSTNDNSQNMSPIIYNDEFETKFGRSDNVVYRLFNGYYNNQTEIWVVNKKGISLDIYRNGVKVSTDYDVSGLAFGSANPKITLGALIKQLNSTGKYFFSGDIVAFGAYYKQLTFSEVDYLNTGLANKYNVSLNNEYAPLYFDDTDLVIAFESRSILLSSANNGLELPSIYPINLGDGSQRETYKISTSGKNITYNELTGKKEITLPGTQTQSVSADLTPLSSAMGTGGIADQPVCIFVAGKYTADNVNQIMFGLGLTFSLNNNMLSVGRSSINQNKVHRQIGTLETRDDLGALDNGDHIVCANLKTGGLLDLWVDGVKTQINADMTTGNAVGQPQRVTFGNYQGNAAAVTGSFKLGYIYDDEKTDQYITDSFAKINAELNIY